MAHTRLISSGSFSEISTFMPGLKSLMQIATQLRVWWWLLFRKQNCFFFFWKSWSTTLRLILAPLRFGLSSNRRCAVCVEVVKIIFQFPLPCLPGVLIGRCQQEGISLQCVVLRVATDKMEFTTRNSLTFWLPLENERDLRRVLSCWPLVCETDPEKEDISYMFRKLWKVLFTFPWKDQLCNKSGEFETTWFDRENI